MKIKVRNSSMVRPAEETPKRRLWVSNLDLLVKRMYTPFIFFYRSNGSPDFFNPNSIKEALGRALVSFYPIAGRPREDPDGRVHIDCNGEGVLFLEAETTSVLDDLHDFASMDEYDTLLPSTDFSLCAAIQLTYFKCGGVSVGLGMNHLVADGSSSAHFVNTWAEIARGLEPTIPPVHDRSLLRARDPPQPKFDHIEFQPPPDTPPNHPRLESTNRLFKITSDQINTLKARCKQDDDDDDDETTTATYTYTTNDVLSGHIWRCVYKARGAKDEAMASLLFPVNTRPRLQPALSPGYFGNAIVSPVVVARANDLVLGPDWYAASRIHEAVARTDNEYLMSTLDYLELQPHLDGLYLDPNSCRPQYLAISSWRWMPFYDSDFGWGRSVFFGCAGSSFVNVAVILPCPVNDGSVSFIICLPVEHMKLFEMHLYHI